MKEKSLVFIRIHWLQLSFFLRQNKTAKALLIITLFKKNIKKIQNLSNELLMYIQNLFQSFILNSL